MAGNANSGRHKGKSLSPKVQEEIRKKIDTVKIVNALAEHVEHGSKMDQSQIRAAEILLNKTVPNLQATQLSQDPDNPINPIISDKPMKEEEFDSKYTNRLGSTERTSKSIN